MASDLNTEIKIGADASGVEAGVSRAKRSLKDLGDSAKKAGQDAGAGMASVGTGGDKAAKDVERATKNIQGQLQRAIASFDAGEKGSRKFYESLARQRGADVNTLKPLLDQLDAYKSKSEAAAQASAKVGTSFTGLSTAAGLAARAMAAIGITASVGEFVRMADASTNVASRLGLVTSSAAELANVQQRLFGIAQSSRVSFTDLVGTYAQVARSTKDLGVSQTALLGVIQTISQAVTISGGSAASAQAALTQLSQGFAAGALRGEELNSIMEQTPRLAQAIADGMGVSVGKLRELGQAGELTAEKVLGALEKSAASVAAEFGKMAVTVEQASTNAANSVLRLVGAFDRLLGVTSAIGGAIQTISNGLDFLSSDVEKLGNQGPLRDAAREVINLNAAAERLRTGMASGVLGPNAQGELDRINARLAEAKKRFRELDQQLGGAPSTYDNRPEDRRLAEGSREAARIAKLREDANAFRLNQAGVPASYLKDMAELIRLNQAGAIVGKEYTDALKVQQDLLLKKTTTVRGSVATANAEQNAYESLIASIRAKIEADNLEIAGGAALTESQRIRIKLDQDLAAGRVKLTAQNERAVRLALEELAASEASALAAKTLAKANLDAAASREKYLTSLSTGLDKIKADTAAQIQATERMGLSKEAIAELDAAKLEMLATDLELQAIKAMDRNLDEQTYNALKQQAEAYRELAAAKKAGAAKEMELDLVKANQEAAKKAADEWQRAADDINRSLTDALLRGFESGKGFAENLRSTLKNMFSTLVLRPIISAAMSPVAGAVNGILYGNAAAAVGGGANALGMLGSGANLINGLQGTSGVLGTVGGWLGLNTAASNAALASTIGIDAASAAAAANGAAAAGGGVLSGIGTALPWVAGAAALFSIIKGLDDSGTLHTGGAAQYSAATGLRTSLGFRDNEEGLPSYNPRDNIDNQFGLGFGYVERGDQTIDAVSNLARGLGTALDGIAVAFGQRAGYEIATAFADDTSKDGAWGALRISREGQDLLNWENTRQSRWAPREFGDGEEGYKQYLAAVAKDTRQVLLDMDLPSWADKMLTSIGESASLEQLTGVLTQIGAIKTQFVQLGKAMEIFDGISSGMESALLSAAGSIDALTASAAGYYDAVYTEQEKIARAREQLESTLAGYGQSLPATREQYRALVEQQVAAGESGAEFAVVLMGLAGTFAQVADDIDAQFAEIGKSAADVFSPLLESIKQARADVAGTRANMLKSDQAMTASQIAAAIGAAMVYAPNTAGVVGAQGEVAAAAAQVAQRQSALDAARAVASANQQSILAGLNKAVAPRTSAPGMTNDSLWEEIIGRNWQAHVARFGKGWNTRTTTDAERAAAINAISREYSDAKNAEVYAAANWQSVQDAPSIAAAQSALAAAQAALATAQQAEVQARADYAAQLNQFVTAAGGSVSKLSGLREEVVRFYEEQAQAVQSMIASATNLRSVAGSVRMGQLDSAQTASQLGNSYAMDYSMALATTGTTRAGYADSLASTLPTLAEAIKAEAISASDWRVQTGKLLAQATGVAGMLEADAAGSDYQSVSLGLLGSIDTALAQLEGSTKSAEQVISQAIKDGTTAQLTGLRAVVAALRGDPIPAFATGGFHAGGLRLVGENGPELEATGPSRIWSAQQTAALFAGNGQGSNEALVSEIRALRSENQAQAAAMVNMQRELNKLMQRWDSQGMPEERIV